MEVRRLSCSVAFNGSTCFANVVIVQPQKHSALSWICSTLTEFRTSCFATMYSICSLSGLVKFSPSANSLSSLTLELKFGASHLSIQKNRGKEKSYLYFLELHIRINTPNSPNRLIDYVSGMLKLRIFQNLQIKIYTSKKCKILLNSLF